MSVLQLSNDGGRQHQRYGTMIVVISPVAGRALLRAGLILAVSSYCWVAAELRPFTSPMYAVTAATIAAVGMIAWGRRDHTVTVRPAVTWTQSAAWLVLFGLLAAVEGEAYLSSPRAGHPTLSSMADAAMGTHPGRAIMFALWLAAGWAAFARRRLS